MAEPEKPNDPTAEGAEDDKGPSKKALKKAEKEREKAEKAKQRKEAEEAQKKEAAANDISAKDYGDLPVQLPAQRPATSEDRLTLEELAKKYNDTSFADEAGGPTVVFRAVVENARAQGAKLTFLNLRHRLSSIQAVVAASESLSRQMVKFAGSITSQSVVRVHGLVKKPRDPIKSASISNLEIHVTRLFVVSRADPLPVQIEDCERALPEEGAGEEGQKSEDGRPVVSLNTRLNYRFIDLRSQVAQSILSVSSGVERLFVEFLRERDFVSVHTPKLLSAPSEGGGNVFEVKYFNNKAFLAQSPQLYKQMLIPAKERIFEVGTVFRAENSNTNRHLTEYTGLDLEMAFDEHYHEVVDLLEALMLYIFNGLRSRYSRETAIVRATYHVDEFRVPEAGKVPRLDFAEGVAMLRADGISIGDYDDITTAQEKHLGKLVLQKYGSDFYILDKYPLAARPFYTMPASVPAESSDAAEELSKLDLSESYSNSYDFHMRGQEILSGAQRIHDAGLLTRRMLAQDPPMDPNAPGIKDYVDSFRAGCPPHGGAGLGLERIVMLWLGLPNIRLASAFPRDPGRLAP